MADIDSVAVRRAQAEDAEQVAEFLNRALREHAQIEPQTVIARMGDVGFFLAEHEGQLTGVIGWQVENLVARVTDLLIVPARERRRVAEPLFDEMESAAMDLQAEAALLFVPRSSQPELIEFCKTLGYQVQTVAVLPRPWRETAYEAGRGDDEVMLVKQLRSERVVRPL